jgi:hypothetical protein
MTTLPRPVPATLGSPAFRSLELDGFSVVEAWFSPGEYQSRHTHEVLNDFALR